MGDMADLISDGGDPSDWYELNSENVICKFCGRKDLRWIQLYEKWRLYEGDSLHNCSYPQLKPKGVPVEKEKFEIFYILWQPESNLPPTTKFFNRKEAYEIAENMTRKHKVSFYVMKAQGVCSISEAPITWQPGNSKKGK